MSVTYIAPLFYLTRGLSLAISGKWPQPTPYLFVDTGFPSLFVSYAATNDFYFSGHIGMTTFIFIITTIYGYRRLSITAGFALVYTWFMLTVTGGHYTNDMIVGLVMAVLASLLGFKYMYSWTYRLLEVYCSFTEVIEERFGVKEKYGKKIGIENT